MPDIVKTQKGKPDWVTIGAFIVALIAVVTTAGVYIGSLRSDVDTLHVQVDKFEKHLTESVNKDGEGKEKPNKGKSAVDPLSEPEHVPREVKGGGPWGDWEDKTFCPRRHYVCGLQQKVEKHKKEIDDTALNSVRILCCQFSNASTSAE